MPSYYNSQNRLLLSHFRFKHVSNFNYHLLSDKIHGTFYHNNKENILLIKICLILKRCKVKLCVILRCLLSDFLQYRRVHTLTDDDSLSEMCLLLRFLKVPLKRVHKVRDVGM